MTPEEIALLNHACRSAGIDSKKIRPENPFSRSGGTAAMLQTAVAAIDPAQAARWRVAAGSGLSVATLAEMQSGGELSEAAKADLWEHDHVYVSEKISERQQEEKRLLALMDAEADKSRRRREGDKAVDAQNERAAADAKALAESAEHARQMQQRIHQKQVESARMAGRLL